MVATITPKIEKHIPTTKSGIPMLPTILLKAVAAGTSVLVSSGPNAPMVMV
ncbi:hypothetical protein JCM5805K_2965 [Lactococcus lactis subsp. lactis]|uniref:Uncharacterized protein n=1 Tax=Lactococcus lactis subsp. lactis TaxID=1360 RepID=A0A0B8QXN7_LACLL|nr:hypothetical protein JCM5805K_2965 [Lactococcus lactis subsp. lactis]